MNTKTMIAAAAAAVALLAPATASASYSISQRDAEATTLRIAEQEYGDRWGVTADGAYCRPQGVRTRRTGERFRFRYHRWTCTWVGTDADSLDVYGSFIVAGQSGGGYRYRAVFGGLRWD